MANNEGSARRHKGTAADARGRGGEAISRLALGSHQKITPGERAAAVRFIRAALEVLKQYNAMEEEEVEEEYRRAGNLHKYDPDTEWQKRYARVARMYPPPDFIVPRLDEFTKILEEDEQDLPIGLASCVGIFADHPSDDDL
ncbi:unnamed protein product [Urochloa decumbens]|uniref:Uncharacterized protein n=1 Tax=Urochloa decumbens TaxID=240449 RepID=A0ABC8ZCD4_9POAL